MSYYIFDPIQFKEFGYHFYQGVNFYYRYQQHKKLFFKNIYIPYGPNCQTKESFSQFLDHIENFRLAKITIDLPAVYSQKRIKEIYSLLKKHKYKRIPYIHQDEETILLFKNTFRLKSKKMIKVRYGHKFCNIAVKKELNDKDIDDIYKIYLGSAKRIGFPPKEKTAFKKLSQKCLVSLAYGKTTNVIEGYVFGYLCDFNEVNLIQKENIKVLFVMFTGLNNEGRKHRLGHSIHYELFNTAFQNYGIDIIDFHGASRTKNRSYVAFKREWGGEFYSLPGSFQKVKF